MSALSLQSLKEDLCLLIQVTWVSNPHSHLTISIPTVQSKNLLQWQVSECYTVFSLSETRGLNNLTETWLSLLVRMKEGGTAQCFSKVRANAGSRGGQEERKQWVTSSWSRPLSKGWKRPLLHLGTNLLTQRPCHTFTVLSTLLTRRHSNCQTEEGNNLHSYVIAGQRAATKHFTSSTLHVTGKKVESAKTKQIRELLLESGQQLEGGGGAEQERQTHERGVMWAFSALMFAWW